MSNELIIFENKELGKVRTVLINDEPWFVGRDVATAIGYSNPYAAIAMHVDDDDKKIVVLHDSKGKRSITIINESGLYSLLSSSQLPTAKEVTRWVTSEVLPAIRKIGGDTTNAETMTKAEALQCKGTDSFERSRSMNELKVFNSPEFGQLRTFDKGGEPYFVGKDVADILGYQNGSRDINRHVDDEDRCKNMVSDGTQLKETILINEAGLYSLVLSSKLPTAKKFKRWVTSEVLPSIRKHGAYLTPSKIEEALLNPDTLIKLATELKAEREARKYAELEAASAKQEIGELKPKADYTDLILSSNNTVPITVIAKDYGMSAKAFNEKLHELHVIYKLREQWLLYAKYQNKGYTHSKTFHLTHHNGTSACRMQTEWTQKGRLFLYQLLKKHDILPMIERDDTEAEDLEKL